MKTFANAAAQISAPIVVSRGTNMSTAPIVSTKPVKTVYSVEDPMKLHNTAVGARSPKGASSGSRRESGPGKRRLPQDSCTNIQTEIQPEPLMELVVVRLLAVRDGPDDYYRER